MKKIFYFLMLVCAFSIGNSYVQAESITCKYDNFTITVTEENVSVKGYATSMSGSELKVEDFIVSGEFKCLNSIYYTLVKNKVGPDMEIIAKDKPTGELSGLTYESASTKQISLSSNTNNSGNSGNSGNGSQDEINATFSCTDEELAKILNIARDLLKVVTILVPVLLVVLLIIDIMKTITSSEVDQKKLFKSISSRIIAAIVVFLVPYIIDFIVDVIPMGASNWRDCWGVEPGSVETEKTTSSLVDDANDKIKALKDYLLEPYKTKDKVISLYCKAKKAIDSIDSVQGGGAKMNLESDLNWILTQDIRKLGFEDEIKNLDDC